MIYGFPKLYKDELFISGLSRFSVNIGIHRDYTFMDHLFDGTPQYPSFELSTALTKLAKKLEDSSFLDKDKIIQSHSMFPLHSPFISENAKSKAYNALYHDISSCTPAHQLGLVSKFLHRDNRYKFCTPCNQEMKEKYGQYYWKRSHQTVGVEVCIKHKCLLQRSTALIHKDKRYLLVAASPNNCNTKYSTISEFSEIGQEMGFNLKVARLIDEIFKLPDKKPPTLWQWTHFYRDLANENGLIITENLILDRKALINKLDPIFKFNWLAKKSINQEMEIYNRILLIFYKHNGAFNYLIHIFIWAGFYKNPNVHDIFDRVSQYPDYQLYHIETKPNHSPSIYELKNRRIEWRKILKENKSKKIEHINTEIAPFVSNWFMQYDKEWFNKINNEHTENNKPNKRKPSKPYKLREKDWPKIDSEILDTLKQIHEENYENINSQKQGKYWYLNQVRSRFIEKNWLKLTSTINFFSEYSESTPIFQIRRFSKSLLNFNYNSKTTIASLLNANNIYNQTIKTETKQFVECVTPYFSKFVTMPKDAADNYFGVGFEIDGIKYPELKALLNSKAANRLNFILRLFGGLKVVIED